MNGRVYDPVLGRFLSADPHVDDATDAQGFNRYSYVSNNPMNATDPSGFFKLKDALKIVAIVVIAAVAAHFAIAAWGMQAGTMTTMFGTTVSTLTPQTALASGLFSTFGSAAVTNGIIGGLAGGFASGFAGSLLNGGSVGDAFKAGLIGGVAGAITGGVAGHYQGQWNIEKIAAKTAASAAASEIQGGDWRSGAILSVSMETLATLNHAARQTMIRQSQISDPKDKIAYNAQGKSRSFWGDFFKLGGARHEAGKNWAWELNNPKASTMGRMQGGPGWIRIPGIYTYNYEPGSFGDNVVESYAGIHDLLNSWYSYDAYGNNVTRTGISKLFGEVLNYTNVLPATPFAAAAAYSHFSYIDPMAAWKKKDDRP